MDGDKLNNCGYPPASTSLAQENDEVLSNTDVVGNTGVLSTVVNAKVNPMSFPHTPFSTAPLPWRHMHGTHHPYPYGIHDTRSNSMVDLNQLPNFQDPRFDPNYINIASNIPTLNRQHSSLSELEGMGVSCPHDRIGAAGSVMNVSPHFSSFQNPEFNQNFSLSRGNAGGVFDMNTQAGEADFGYTSGPHLKSFGGLGGGKAVSCHPQHTVGTNIGSRNQLNIAQFRSPKRVDGNFLSLGIEGKTDALSKSDLSNRAIAAGILDRAVSSQLNVSHVQAAGSSLNSFLDPVSGSSCFQNNVGGFATVRNNVEGRTSSRNNAGVMSSTNSDLNSSPFHTVQNPQANKEHGFPKPCNMNLGFVSNKDSRYANLDPYKNFLGQHAAPSGRCSSSSAWFLDPGKTGASGLAPNPVNLFWNVQPTPDQLQKQFRGTVQNSLSELSNLPSCAGYSGISSRPGCSGQLFPASRDTAAQAVDTRAQLPSRKRDLLPLWRKRDQQGGCTQEGLPVHLSKDLLIPTSAPGRINSSPKNYGLHHASNVLCEPPHKRSIIHPYPSAARVQRRKTTLQSPISPYAPSRLQTAPADSLTIPVPEKSEGSVSVRPSGQKCMICTRDLLFAPEGPVHQPAVPPVVAVLPCQHTFHDDCLQRITPPDQAKNPPCIPCALGET